MKIKKKRRFKEKKNKDKENKEEKEPNKCTLYLETIFALICNPIYKLRVIIKRIRNENDKKNLQISTL